jgi:hypothetical protein
MLKERSFPGFMPQVNLLLRRGLIKSVGRTLIAACTTAAVLTDKAPVTTAAGQ